MDWATQEQICIKIQDTPKITECDFYKLYSHFNYELCIYMIMLLVPEFELTIYHCLINNLTNKIWTFSPQ